MNIAVITPVFQSRLSRLEQCVASVRGQSVACTHFLVNDGDLSLDLSRFAVSQIIHVSEPHHDFGNTARAIGSASAIAREFDALAYLDANCWFDPDHLKRMVELHHQTGAVVCSSARALYDEDGNFLDGTPESDGEPLADASCLFLTKAAFGIVPIWYSMPRTSVNFGHRVIWQAILEMGFSRAYSAEATVHCRVASSARLKSLAPAADLNPKPNASVSLCVIVKNEEKNLAVCLKPIKNLFAEIVVVDTGSTDRTKEIAASLGAKVHEFAWADSFAAARNECLRHASSEWALWLDADDRLDESNLAKLRALLSNLSPDNTAYVMRTNSKSREANGSGYVVDHVRLFRNRPEVRWTYRVHEQILHTAEMSGARAIPTDIVIDHVGYQEPGALQRKRQRNLRLLELDLDQMPRDAFLLFNIAAVWVDERQLEKAVSFFRQCLEHAPAGASFVPKAYVLLLRCLQALGREMEALGICGDATQRFAADPELWFEEGIIRMNRGDAQGARGCFEKSLAGGNHQAYGGRDEDLEARTRHNLAILYRQLGMLSGAEVQWRAAVEHSPDFGPAWLGLLEFFLLQRKTEEINRLMTRAQATSSADIIVPVLQARLLVVREDNALAQQILEEAIARDPDSIWLRFFLCDFLLVILHDQARAEHHLRTILARDPSNIQASQKLYQVLSKRAF